MRARNFCTHFDSNYLPHAMSLYKSLTMVCPEATLYMFCLDDASYQTLSSLHLSNAVLVHSSELEKAFPDLAAAKNNRSKVEYFYTCSPATCYYVINFFNDIEAVTYLDADLFFYTSPQPIFDELKEASIGIIAHKFSFFAKRNRVYGNFNVGWITFRNDVNGVSCLKKWMDNCIEWCYQRLEDGKYADQKYLDYWQADFQGVHVIENIGANVAIWNINNYHVHMKNGVVMINDRPLIFYHFANLKQLSPGSFKTDLSRVFKRTAGVIKNDIYLPYILSLVKFRNKDKEIVAKKDAHAAGFGILIRKITRNLREFLFPDIIKIN